MNIRTGKKSVQKSKKLLKQSVWYFEAENEKIKVKLNQMMKPLSCSWNAFSWKKTKQA